MRKSCQYNTANPQESQYENIMSPCAIVPCIRRQKYSYGEKQGFTHPSLYNLNPDRQYPYRMLYTPRRIYPA